MGCCCCCSPIFCACYSTLIQVVESIIVSILALLSYKCRFSWLKPQSAVGRTFIWDLYYEYFYSHDKCVARGNDWSDSMPDYKSYSITNSRQTYAWFSAFLANACLWGTSAICLFIFRKTKFAHTFWITCSYITLAFDMLLFAVFLADIKVPIDMLKESGIKGGGLTELMVVLILPLYFSRGFFGWFSNYMTIRRITERMRALKSNKVLGQIEAPNSNAEPVLPNSSNHFHQSHIPVAFENNALTTVDEYPPPSSDYRKNEPHNRNYPQYSREPRNFEVSAAARMESGKSLASAPTRTAEMDDRTIDRIPYESMEPYMPQDGSSSRYPRFEDERKLDSDRGNKEKDFNIRELDQSPRMNHRTTAAKVEKPSVSSYNREEKPSYLGENSRKTYEPQTPHEPIPDYDKKIEGKVKSYQEEPEMLKAPQRSPSDVNDRTVHLLSRPSRRLSGSSDASDGKKELRNQLPWSYVRPNDILLSSSRINAAKHKNEVLRNQSKSSVAEESDDDMITFSKRECEYASIQHLPTDDNYILRKFLSENNVTETQNEVIYESLDNVLRRKESLKRKVLLTRPHRRSSSYLETALDDDSKSALKPLLHKQYNQSVRLPLYENLPQPKKLSSSVKDLRGRNASSSTTSPATRLKHMKALSKKKNEGEGLGQLCTDEFEIESFSPSPLALQPARVTPDSPRKANKNQRVRFSLDVEKALQEKEARSLFKCYYTASNQLLHLPPCNGHICTYIVSDETENSV